MKGHYICANAMSCKHPICIHKKGHEYRGADCATRCGNLGELPTKEVCVPLNHRVSAKNHRNRRSIIL